MIKLENTIKVFVPVTNNDGVKVDLNPEIKAALTVIGGATTYSARGSWVDDNKLYTDNINVMQFNTMDFDKDVIRVISELVYAIFNRAEQLAVSVEINGVLYILESVDDIEKLF
jgi:hypothetical protein